MINVNMVFFVFLCVFALIGAIVSLFILAYFIGGILDLTYHERHPNEKEKKCPYEIEGKDNE